MRQYPELSPSLFALFTGLVEETSGLHHGESERELFASKLVAHAEERGFDALLDYYYRLRYDDPNGEELRALIEALLIHESYFFRELPPLAALLEHCIAPAIRARGKARVWSAACAAGEEPYTLAMLLDQRGLLDRVEIVGTDLSAATIERAKRGRYSPRAVREAHPADLTKRYLDVTPQGVTVSAQIREAVQLFVLNLVDDAALAPLGLFDAIICRNVLIYFQDAQVRSVIERLASHLAPDGLLAVGVSESLLRFGTTLVCDERGSSFFYRRPR